MQSTYIIHIPIFYAVTLLITFISNVRQYFRVIIIIQTE